jgi:hypothetical protein
MYGVLGGMQGRVICAEPIPNTFSVLEDNLARHQHWCRERGALSFLLFLRARLLIFHTACSLVFNCIISGALSSPGTC